MPELLYNRCCRTWLYLSCLHITCLGFALLAYLHSNEVFFRETAHGFLAWAFATLISATALVSTTAYLANGAVAGMGGAAAQNSQPINPAQVYIDKLFRTTPTASPASTDNAAAGGAASPAQNNLNQTRADHQMQ